MSHSWKANQGPDRHKGEVYQPADSGFELYAEDVWEDDATGRFAKEQWSIGPQKRRSKWLGKRLGDVRIELEGNLEYFDLRA
ncbi:MAG: hypothetical protein ACJA2W_002884 [Planctomycetota bacterium]|jgi:hypothetical protein